MTIPKRREKKVAASVSNRIRANGDLQQDPAWLRNFRVVQECGEVFGSCRVNVNVKKGVIDTDSLTDTTGSGHF
jgi:hypothetical protein